METSLNEIADRALALPIEERTILAQRLWDSVEGFIEPGIEQEWLTVAEKRWQEIKEEKVRCIPAKKAIKRAKASLKKK